MERAPRSLLAQIEKQQSPRTETDTLPILSSIHIFVIFVFHWNANYALFTHTHTHTDTDAIKLHTYTCIATATDTDTDTVWCGAVSRSLSQLFVPHLS